MLVDTKDVHYTLWMRLGDDAFNAHPSLRGKVCGALIDSTWLIVLESMHDHTWVNTARTRDKGDLC